MKRIINADMSTTAATPQTAIKRFFKKYPELKEAWEEMIGYMFENGIEFESDCHLADGTYSSNWCWALHAIQDDDNYYIAIIERLYE